MCANHNRPKNRMANMNNHHRNQKSLLYQQVRGHFSPTFFFLYFFLLVIVPSLSLKKMYFKQKLSVCFDGGVKFVKKY